MVILVDCHLCSSGGSEVLESTFFDIFINDQATIRKLLYSFSQCEISIENGDIVTEIHQRK
jgi:hypothetical protein